MNAPREEEVKLKPCPLSSKKSTNFEIWKEYFNHCWFWKDSLCEEVMGPFDSEEEALDDYAKCRSSAPTKGES